MSAEPTHAEMLSALRIDFTRIETKIDMLLDGRKDHETRIRALEVHRNWLAGVAAAIGSILGFDKFVT